MIGEHAFTGASLTALTLFERPDLCWLVPVSRSTPRPTADRVIQVRDEGVAVGVIVCKQEMHRGKSNRGYIGMLSILKTYRKRGIGRAFRWPKQIFLDSDLYSKQASADSDRYNEKQRSRRGTLSAVP